MIPMGALIAAALPDQDRVGTALDTLATHPPASHTILLTCLAVLAAIFFATCIIEQPDAVSSGSQDSSSSSSSEEEEEAYVAM
jgi:hypothetical protein